MTTYPPRIMLTAGNQNAHPASDFWVRFYREAAAKPKVLLFPESTDKRVLSAVSFLAREKIVKPALVGAASEIFNAAEKFGIDVDGIEVWEFGENLDLWAMELFEARKSKGLSQDEAKKLLADPLYAACMALKHGQAAGVVAGAVRTTADTVRAGFATLGLAPGAHAAFGFFLAECPHAPGGPRRIAFADAAVSPRPSPRFLAAVAVEAARTFEHYAKETPRVAFLSFSTRGSAEDDSVTAVREAVKLAKAKAPDLAIDGELQGDAALNPDIAAQKGAGDSPVAGQANVLIFPDLNAGNIGYKLVQHLGGAHFVGPLLIGLAKPMTDLSRGATDLDIADAAALVSLWPPAGH